MFAVMKTFATDISASTGRNDFIFDIWFLYGDLYRHFLVMGVEIYLICTNQ
jgi:hypothetical protein